MQWCVQSWKPVGICLFKVNYGNTKTMYEIYSKITKKTSKRRTWMTYHYRLILNPDKHLMKELFPKVVNSEKPFTIFAKISFMDVWLGPNYTFDGNVNVYYYIMMITTTELLKI